MLTPRKKMTRKELHKDPLMDRVAAASDYVQIHSQKIMYAVGALAAVAIVVYAYVSYRNNLNDESIDKLSTPERIFFSGDYREAIKKLEKYCAAYDGTRGGGVGTYYLAMSYFQTDQVDFAMNNFKLYVDNYADNDVFTAAAMAGIAACYESQNQYDEACAEYQKVIDKYPHFFQKPSYMLDLARCYRMLHQPDHAREWLDRVVKEFPETTYARDAKSALDELG